MIWSDISTYSRSDKNRIPSAYEIRSQGMSIRVHRHMDFNPDVWVFTAIPFFDKRPLKNKEVDAARKEAAEMVSGRLKIVLEALDR